jgi:hypothetical protein
VYYNRGMTLEEQAATLSTDEIVGLLAANACLRDERDELRSQHDTLQTRHTQLEQDYAKTKQELEWFRRQYFGQKSERRAAEPD